jgi:hypothetical protein
MFLIDLLKLKFLLFASFSKARDELKEKRGVEYSYPVLAFYFVYFPGQKGFKHATDSGYYGRGTYFSVSYFTIKIRLNSNAHLLI